MEAAVRPELVRLCPARDSSQASFLARAISRSGRVLTSVRAPGTPALAVAAPSLEDLRRVALGLKQAPRLSQLAGPSPESAAGSPVLRNRLHVNRHA